MTVPRVMPRTTSRIAAAFRRLGKAPLDILALLFEPRRSRSYWPEERRKRRSRVFADLLWWLIRYGEVNGYYYVYGLDRAGIDRRKDLLPYRAFRRIRNRANLRTNEAPWNYVCVLRDKLLFATVACGLGIPTPRPYSHGAGAGVPPTLPAHVPARCAQWHDVDAALRPRIPAAALIRREAGARADGVYHECADGRCCDREGQRRRGAASGAHVAPPFPRARLQWLRASRPARCAAMAAAVRAIGVIVAPYLGSKCENNA